MSDLVCSCFRLRRAARRVTNAYDRALAPIGITAVQFTVLAEIARNSGLSVAALGDRLATERTAMSRVVKPLLQAGLVEDGPGDDARARHLRLTEMGLERLHAGSNGRAGVGMGGIFGR